MDKLHLDCLLFSCKMKRHWLKLFSACANDRSKGYGPEWNSHNRRYELARYCYEYWYNAVTVEERNEFHRIASLQVARGDY